MASNARTRVVAATLAATTVLALAGCASWGLSQNAWAGALESIDGVVSVDWSYRNNWPSSGARYDAHIIVSPDLTADQAHAIAAESCAHETRISSVELSTTSAYSDPRKVEQPLAAEDACVEAETLVQFSQASAAMNALPTEFIGEFRISGVRGSGNGGSDAESSDAESSDADASGSDAYGVTVSATEDSMLLDALRALHDEIDAYPLEFGAATSDNGRTLTAFGESLDARITPEADLERLLPVIARAFGLERHAIIVDDDSVTVRLASSDAEDSPEVRDFLSFADGLGVDALASVAPANESDDGGAPVVDGALVDAIAAVPGGANVVFHRTSPEISVFTNEIASAEAVVRLLAASPETRNLFRVHTPEPGLFWVTMRTGSVAEQVADEAFASAVHVREQLTGIDRVILDLSPDSLDLTVRLANTADANDEGLARDVLASLADDGAFDEIRLGGPDIEFDDEIID